MTLHCCLSVVPKVQGTLCALEIRGGHRHPINGEGDYSFCVIFASTRPLYLHSCEVLVGFNELKKARSVSIQPVAHARCTGIASVGRVL